MIKSETGTVSMRGTTPVLVSELAFMVKGMPLLKSMESQLQKS